MMVRPLVSAGSRAGFGLRSVVALVAAALLAGACNKNTSDRDITTITAADARRLLNEREGEHKALFVDPRTPAEFAAGHIPGARNLRLTDAPPDGGRERSLERYDKLVVYGNDPSTATAKAMNKRLMSLGYDKVRWFVGGLAEWVESGGAVETGP